MTIKSSRIGFALVAAAVYLLVPLLARLSGWHALDGPAVIRINGVMAGGLLMFWANAVPKMLPQMNQLGCAPARDQALRRLVGWAMVLGGFGYLLAFAFAPIAVAAELALCLLAPALLVTAGVLTRCVWMRRTAR